MKNNSHKSHAHDLHRQAIVIDGHSDILLPISGGKTRIGQSVNVPDPAVWKPPVGLSLIEIGNIGDWQPTDNLAIHSLYYGSMGQYQLPQLLAGGVTALGCAVYIEDGYLSHALEHGLRMALWLHREIEENEDLLLVTSVADIQRAKREGKCGLILTFEGFDALSDSLEFLDLYYKLGLRVAGLTHTRRNLFADGAQGEGVKTGGLTDYGRAAVKRMNELGILIDLAHISEAGFWEIIELSTAPVIISHATPTMFPAAAPRPKEQILGFDRPGLVMKRDRPFLKALAGKGGVLGIIFFAQRDMDDIVADIELALEIMGPDHVGLGSDFCGRGLAPSDLQDISALPALTERLAGRGLADETILKILGQNYLRVFDQVWRAP